MLRLRMFAIAADEDSNDCTTLRCDPVFKMALGRPLRATSPTRRGDQHSARSHEEAYSASRPESPGASPGVTTWASIMAILAGVVTAVGIALIEALKR